MEQWHNHTYILRRFEKELLKSPEAYVYTVRQGKYNSSTYPSFRIYSATISIVNLITHNIKLMMLLTSID